MEGPKFLVEEPLHTGACTHCQGSKQSESVGFIIGMFGKGHVTALNKLGSTAADMSIVPHFGP